MFFIRSPQGKISLFVAAVTAVAVAAFALPGASAHAPSAGRSVTTASVATTQALAKHAPGTLTTKVRGTFGRNGTVRGTFDPDRFFVKRGETYANGVLHATLRRGDGTVVGTANRHITIPVRHARTDGSAAKYSRRATCDILNLVLGPLDLNLLGLEVHLNRVVLDIIARTGAGNLLGNLLCAVAGLLDGSQLRLSNVLNRILAILRI